MKQCNHQPPLLLEAFSNWLARTFRTWRIPFLASLIWGALAYMFAFTNKLINHDEAGQLFSKGSTVTSGRWGLGFLDTIFPNVSMPWIYGVITVLLISVSICLIISLFSIRSNLLRILLAGSVMVFPSLIGVFGYMFTSSSYGVSFFLAVFSVWLLCRPCKWAFLPALISLIASLSIYQAYISIAASLLVLVLIQKLLTGDAPPAVFKKGVCYVLFLLIGLVSYYLITQLILKVQGIVFNEYTANNVSFSITLLPYRLQLAYSSFFQFFYTPAHRLMPTAFSQKIHLVLLAAIAVLLLLWCRKQRKPFATRFLLLLFLLAVLPLAINCMYLITSEYAIHTLVLYGFIGVYILTVILADLFLSEAETGVLPELLRRVCVDGIALILACVVMVNVYTANTAYLNMHLRYENSYSFYTALAAQIQQMPEFKEDTRLAVIGYWQHPKFYETHMDFTYYLTGVTGFTPSTYSAQAFLNYYIGFPIQFVSDSEKEALRQSDAVRNMPCYPYYGSVSVIDNVIVVKLSE